MNSHAVTTQSTGSGLELRFQSLFNEGRALSFPCDAAGVVDIDALSLQARDNFLQALRAIGRDYTVPAVTARVLN